MSLALNLDQPIQIIAEPGFYQRTSSGDLRANMQTSAGFDPTVEGKIFWFDPATGTLMLRPQQLDGAWLNTEKQLTSVIGFAPHGSGFTLDARATDLTNKGLFEANRDQNPNNPWIYYGAPYPSNPQAPLGFIYPTPGQLQSIEKSLSHSLFVAGQEPFPEMSPDEPGPPGAAANVKWLVSTDNPLPANQALYLRWSSAKQAVGTAANLFFIIGQFCITIQGADVTISEDRSKHKDKTDWVRVATWPMFNSVSGPDHASNLGDGTESPPSETGAEDRSLLWLPFDRHMVLLFSSAGEARVFRARPFPVGNGQKGTDRDWDIVVSSKLEVWALSPSSGAFQIQRVKYPHHGGTGYSFNVPRFVIPYQPASPLGVDNIFPDVDVFHQTVFDWTIPVTPPGYDPPYNNMNTCVKAFTNPSDLRSQHGMAFLMDSDPGGHWTPFVYGFDIRVAKTVTGWVSSPFSVGDQSPASARIKNAHLTASLEPEDCRLEAEVWDFFPQVLANRYYRSDAPIALFETTPLTRYFIGLTDPNELNPLRWDLQAPRVLHLNARGLWKMLQDTTLQDQRDWGPDFVAYKGNENPTFQKGKGHIFVVNFIAQEAGVDTTGADYGPGIGSTYDWPLGGLDVAHPVHTGQLYPAWKPHNSPPDTAASFIKRIAKLFSGWDVGFHPDGQFFYHPKDWYNTSELIFHIARSSGSPVYYRETVEFRLEPPELNALRIQSWDHNNNPLISSWWVDWSSILNTSAKNFVGRWKPGVVVLAGPFTCTELNRIARQLWDTGRRRYITARFDAEWQPNLKVGHCFQLEGQPGLYRVRDFEVEYRRVGYHRATYTAEFVERGYGV